MAKRQKPFDKIMSVRTTLDMYVKFGDAALRGQSVEDFLKDVQESFEHLMAFRNIINGMVTFDETPTRAALFYVPSNEIEEAAQELASA